MQFFYFIFYSFLFLGSFWATAGLSALAKSLERNFWAAASIPVADNGPYTTKQIQQQSCMQSLCLYIFANYKP